MFVKSTKQLVAPKGLQVKIQQRGESLNTPKDSKVIICVDGLGGNPVSTFGYFKGLAESAGHVVRLVDTSKVVNHDDRVKAVVVAYLDARRQYPHRGIVLVGQSAGGSAVRVALSKLKDQPSGVVLLSPALPRGISYMTRTLLWVMVKHWIRLIRKRNIRLSINDYRKLMSPIEDSLFRSIVSTREVSGVEAYELAFLAPEFQAVKCPVLHVWGECDRWISPRGQRRLFEMLSATSENPERLTYQVVPGAGHSVLHSTERSEVIRGILKWVNGLR